MLNVKNWFLLAIGCIALVGSESFACGSHSCGGGGARVAVSVRVRVSVGGGYGGGCGGGGCGGGYGGGYAYGGGYGYRPFFGRGGVAFRRSFRLARRANRAAFFGFYNRSANLYARSDAAFNRGVNRYNFY